MSTEVHYRYLAPSAVTVRRGAVDVALATSGGAEDHPWLAEGFVPAAQPGARALLLVATVAGKRFWTPPNMVAAAIAASDPVVTTSPDTLRFESFSRCCGVYARFDIDRADFDGPIHGEGTTNVDVNPPLRAALARIGGRDPLLLHIGLDEVAATTLTGRHVERRVPLPERWVRGFAEVGTALAPLEPAFEVHGAGLRRFLESLPTTSARAGSWVVPAGPGARLTTRAPSGGVPADGIERLRVLRELAPFIASLTAFGRPGGAVGPTAWVATTAAGRVTLALSPAPSRGFSGEGGQLLALAEHGTTDQTEAVEAAVMGRLGYDPSAAQWFDRDLPFDRSLLAPGGGRLSNARVLADSGAVDLDADGLAATVKGGADSYRVRQVDGEWRCTCPWWAKHRADRGPCKHMLATVMVRAAQG